ncbi:UspA domain-containing protein [Halogeometricum pallidum JCM 14848]|uniref:UspA domain-containing protein n=1 Tax=Halogeometricum pallidum JCM 14848 TaxID=1227487 RepID=M0D5M4_HALPD|nr:universal stress protein [Halogeometricum pallidum]ELZ29967.1 UspA domain-containing protein [Halogeometricum pallidum JCM 14848]
MPNHVLVPFDGSPLAERALRYACAEYGSESITVLYVVDENSDETAAAGWGDHPSEWDDWLDERRDHARDLFTVAEEIAGEKDVQIRTGVAVGQAAEMIVKAAEEYGADLIVVGVHGQSRLEELVVGDVAKTLVRESPIPVTTVRESDDR